MPVVRTGAVVLMCCCAGLTLAACSGGSGKKTPSSGLTVPSVGRPAIVTSVADALAKEAFTPYAELGIVADDGLAPNESISQLATACITDGGYPDAGSDVPIALSVLPGFTGAGPSWAWGYVGTAEAAQYGFRPAGLGPLGGLPPDTSDLPAAEQTAIDKCFNILMDFTNGQESSALAGIGSFERAITADDAADPAVKQATRAWSACMKKDGYNFANPNTLMGSEAHAGVTQIVPGVTPSPTVNSTQIAAAEADAHCTQSTDLAGIYFAVQASYEQQVVSADAQQLNAAVKSYRAAYQKELTSLPTLLTTASGTPPANGP